MYLKTYRVGREIMIAVCDRDLLGRELQEGDLRMEINDFYRGEPATREEVGAALEEATIANLVGEEAVNCGIEYGFISRDNVLYIEQVPHAQMVKM